MPLDAPLVSRETAEQLGPAGMRRVCDSLWAIDCQWCGLPLGPCPALICKLYTADSGFAEVAHPDCHPPAWIDNGIVIASSGRYTSWKAQVLEIPIGGPPTVMLLVNPSLEQVAIRKGRRGWDVSAISAHGAQVGMRRPNSLGLSRIPSPGLRARIDGPELYIDVRGIVHLTYSGPLFPSATRAIRASGGAFLALTHALNPGEISEEKDVDPILAGDRTVTGWARLDS